MRDLAALSNRADEGPYRWLANAWHMAKHKLNPSLGLVAEMLNNEDFYGRAIVDPTDSTTRQALDLARHVISAFQSFSWRSFNQQRESGAGIGQAAQGFVGITPAPAYVTRSAERQRAIEAQRRYQMTPLERRRRSLAGQVVR